MRPWAIVVALVVIGIVGAWAGYWLGHAFGWTAGAAFPFTIGAGARTIGLSIALSFLGVMAGLWWFVARPFIRMRRVLVSGMPGHATVRRLWRTGVQATSAGVVRRQLGFELDVHPPVGPNYTATALGMLTAAEEAVLTPGAEVTIRYDPVDPSAVAVVGPLVPVG
jgi:hypothetical protein